MAAESCVNSRRLSLCIGPKSAQTPLYPLRVCYKNLGKVNWKRLCSLQSHFCFPEIVQMFISRLLSLFGCFGDGLWGRTATIKTSGQFGGLAQKAWEDLFIPNSTNAKWVETKFCTIQKKLCRDGCSYSTGDWKYPHQSTVFPPDQTASSVLPGGEPNFGRAVITE